MAAAASVYLGAVRDVRVVINRIGGNNQWILASRESRNGTKRDLAFRDAFGAFHIHRLQSDM
jgi:hypothetical protein